MGHKKNIPIDVSRGKKSRKKGGKLRGLRSVLPRIDLEVTAPIVDARGVPETGQWSCCAFVFVDQAAEEIAAVDLFGGWRSGYGLAR